MNFYALITIILSGVYVYYSFFIASNNNLGMFVDNPSMFIVFVGTLMAVLLSIDARRIYSIFTIFIKRFLFGKKYNYKKLIMDVMQITEAYRKGEPLEAQVMKTEDEFLKESITLISDGIIENEQAVNMLIMRNNNLLEINENEANKFKTIAKFPPAFGMIGTTMGMIALLANLGGEDAMKMIGPAMAVALITTLYGAILANLIFIPIAENLLNNSEEIYTKNKIIIAGVNLLIEKTNPIVVAEELNSYLKPSERLDWKEVVR